MHHQRIAYVALLGVLTGCDSSLDSIDGHHLGTPESVIFGSNDSGHTMLVMSDLPNLCEAVRSSDPPERNDFWVVSTWTQIDADTPDRYAVDSFAAITDNGALHEYSTESGYVHIFSNDLGFIKADIDLQFPTGDTVSAEVEGRKCDANLFLGMK